MRKRLASLRLRSRMLWLWSAAICVFAAYMSLLFVLRIR